MQTVAYAAPLGLCVAVPRTRTRDVAVLRAADVGLHGRLQDAPRRRARSRRERVHIAYPIVADRVLGLGELPTRAPAARARAHGPDGRASWRGARPRARVGALVAGSWSPTAPSPTCCVRHPERFPRAAAMTYAVFNIGASVYWFAAHRAALVRGRRGRRATGAGAGRGAADDGRVRRALLERRLGLALQCVRRQPPGRDALIALRHIRDGRAPARRGGAGGRRARLRRTRRRSASRSCTSASTTSWT